MQLKRNFIIATIFLSIFLLVSCTHKEGSRINLVDKISYVETSPNVSIGDIEDFNTQFKKLQKKDFNSLYHLLEDKHNYIWLKADFVLPDYLKAKDLAFFITYLRPACKVWLNDTYLGNYGQLPEDNTKSGFSTAFQAHYYYVSENNLNQDGTNSIYIQIWPGVSGAISDFLFIGEQKDTFFYSELFSFINCKIYFFCAGLMFITFLIYLLI